jgi:hypothetical protein
MQAGGFLLPALRVLSNTNKNLFERDLKTMSSFKRYRGIDYSFRPSTGRRPAIP